MEDELEMDLQDADDSYTPGAHNKLLGAVSQLYEKKRVKAPTRKEPSLEVSEFHLSRPDKKRGQIKVTDLAKVLNKRTTHADISQKLKNAQKRAKTLPKPLEKIHQDKINRKAGYEQAKQQLNRWDAIVYKQKVAEQVSFPLKSDTIKIHESSDVSTLFRKPTELEIELAKILNQPNPFEAKKEEKEGNQNQEEDYPLTLAEVIEKRKMMAKLRAQQSYQQAKAARHSKIKSKKFHQIQRRARVKEQLREFEELQRKDPEAALKKLEELERTRAEERVTLRHRSTGQWAKNLAVRAKYDKEARIALAEQLSKSRELTVKLGKNQEDESDKEEDEEDSHPKPDEDPDNPWVVKQSKEMEDFVSGYRKYWESKGKEEEKLLKENTAVKVNRNEENGNIVEEDINKENTSPKPEINICNKINDNRYSIANDELEEENQTIPKKRNKMNERSDSSINGELHIQKSTPKKLNTCENINIHTYAEAEEIRRSPKTFNGSLTKNMFTVNEVITNKTSNQDEIKKKLLSNFNVVKVSNKKGNKNKIKNSNENKEKLSNSSINSNMNCSVGSWTVSRKKDKSSTEEKTNSFRLSNSFEITESKTADKLLDICNDNQAFNNPFGKHFDERQSSRKNKSLDELFEEVEDRLHDRVRGKIENIKSKINSKRRIEDGSDNDSEEADMPSLQLKKIFTPTDVDAELLQQHGDKSDERVESDLSKTLKTAAGEVKQTENIDPNKFLKVTPRLLLSRVPEIMTEGDEALDDEEKVAEDRHLTISEAFAEDDVVDQFQKEKEEEVKKNSIGDVDLTLPGWGSWAGHNMRSVSRRKRKKFVIKFPKAIPRRDSNRGNVIINEDADKPIKEHQVSEVPFPFTSVEEYEASIRAPLGTTWMPQTAHSKLTLPPVVTKMGTVIAPMDESQLVSKDEALTTNNMKKKPKTINRKKAKAK